MSAAPEIGASATASSGTTKGVASAPSVAGASRDDAGAGAARPLTDAQAGMWYAQRLDARNPVFATAQRVEIDGPLDREAFSDAVRQAMREADALAVRVLDASDEPRQIVDPRHRATLQVVDLRGEPDPAAAAQAAMRADLAAPLDPTCDPLAAQRLFQIGDARHIWYQRAHHLTIDGFGTALLTTRICDLYSSRVSGRPPITQPFGSFGDVLDDERAYRESPRHARDREYWRSVLADAPEAVGLASGVPLTDRAYRRHVVDLSAGTGDALRALADRTDIAWPDLLTALTAAFVSRHIGRREATLGVATMQRMGTPAARVPAMVMNILPVRLVVEEERPLVEWLGEAASTLQRARRHGRYRSEQMRRDLGRLGAERRLYGPLVNVLPFDVPPRLHGLATTLEVLATGPVDDMTVTVRASADLDALRAEIDANPRLYDEEQVAAYAARLAAFIERSLISERLVDVPTVTDAERGQWVTRVNDTAHDVEETTLCALIARTVNRQPDAPALVGDGCTLSYAELDAAIDRVAGQLLAHGVRRGDIVGIALPRSIAQVLALHAAVRVGAAYLPLDLDQPPARLARVLQSAQPRVVVTDAAWRSRLPAETAVMLLEPDAAADVIANVEAPRPDDAAYVIYTSGSTGEPKGVVVEHRAIVNRLEWMRTHYDVGAADRILHKTPATFDVSVWELFLPFVAGAALVIAPPDVHKDPRALAGIMAEQAISIAHFVPSMLGEFLAEPAAAHTRMRAVFVSGEALPAALRDRFHALLRADLHNLYGPTEAAVDVTYWPAAATDTTDPVPIGWPVWNTQVYILDDVDRPVPPGVAGHLCLAGVQLARGYLGRPDLTMERFVANPFGPAGSRMYRTGDLARWRKDGAVEFLGRSDHQVKIRGQRIELGEIEAALTASGLTRRVLVTAREIAPGDTRVIAFVQALDADAARLAADGTLLRQAARHLPDVMVPSAVVPVESWPTTANGKVDLGRLPAPARLARRAIPASTPSERRLAALFAEILRVDAADVGADADFFALGGHSLLATQLMRRVREAWSSDAGLGIVFTHPTVGGLALALDRDAAAIDAAAVDNAAATAAGASTGGTRPATSLADEGLQAIVPLRRVDGLQPPLVCVHPAGGLSWCYGHLARLIEPPRTVLGMQAPALQVHAPHGHAPQAATLDALAADYVARLRAVQPDGPYHLAGWSIGGIIAQAMAVQIEASGAVVAALIMLDAYPSDRWRGAADPDERAALRALLLMAGEDPDAASVDAPVSADSVIRRLRTAGHPLGDLSDAVLSGVLRVVAHNNRLVRRHEHARCAAPLIHFAAALDHAADGCSVEEWRPYVGSIEAHDIAAVHAHMTSPESSRRVAAILAGRARR